MLPALPALAAESLAIDPDHSAVVFSWSHFGISNPVARLEKIDGSVTLNRSDLTKSSVNVKLPLSGLRTGVERLDARLKKPEFLDAAKYPDITFRSTRIEKVGAAALKVIGDLSVHGVTKSVALDAKINRLDATTAGFDADVTIRRSDFGVSKYVPAVTDRLRVHITLDAHVGD
jgi:polyisoprenoid-binding protein YceI